MVKSPGKQYDKHRGNDHKQVCAIIQRQCESRQKCSPRRRTVWSAAWVMVLVIAQAPSPWVLSLAWVHWKPLLTSTSWHYRSLPQPTWAPVWALLQLWNAKDRMQWRGKPFKSCYFMFFRVRVRVVALCCSPAWHHSYFRVMGSWGQERCGAPGAGPTESNKGN